MNTALSVIMPAIPESRINIPDSMRPEDKELLIKELGKISSKLAVRDERDKQLTERVRKLENAADVSGENKALVLQAELDKRDKDAREWKGRVWSIVATFITTGVLALIAHYIATH